MKKVLFVCLAMALMIAPAVMLAAPVAAVTTVVDIDIKPGSDPNSFNVKSKGVLPVAILSTADFDATQVDPDTVKLTYPLFAFGPSPEVSPLRWNLEDVNEDGVMDLVFKFDTQESLILTMTREANGAEMVLRLIGNLKAEFSGTPIAGEDTLRIINKGYDGP
jgi:hypothetical protein